MRLRTGLTFPQLYIMVQTYNSVQRYIISLHAADCDTKERDLCTCDLFWLAAAGLLWRHLIMCQQRAKQRDTDKGNRLKLGINLIIGGYKMKTNSIIIFAVFMAGAAVLYDTENVCKEVAAQLTGADVREVKSFSDLM